MRRRLVLAALLAVLVLIAGCASTGSVWMKQPQTGQVVECGPYFTPTHLYETPGYKKLKDCVADYQRQGWERVPEPSKK